MSYKIQDMTDVEVMARLQEESMSTLIHHVVGRYLNVDSISQH